MKKSRYLKLKNEIVVITIINNNKNHNNNDTIYIL